MKPARRGRAGWIAAAGALLVTACLAGTLTLIAVGARAVQSGTPHYVVNACLTVSMWGMPEVGLGWRSPRPTSSWSLQSFRWVGAHRIALCGALPWATFLPSQKMLALPYSDADATPSRQGGPPGSR
jgi:hypothetical protein